MLYIIIIIIVLTNNYYNNIIEELQKALIKPDMQDSELK